MAIGERIRFIRNLRGMTQKWLGMAIGFDEKTADVRMAQYESGTRTPKENYVADIANALDVSPKALDLPNIESYVGLAHTLFALEDLYAIQIGKIDGEVCLRLDKTKGTTYLSMFDIFHAWSEMAEKLKSGEITKTEYDQWRYRYPELDATGQWVKIPSEELSDAIVKELNKD
ncbi:MAG: helix-turn-helix domain-containing protein [Lachnospiraceae bacterium]|jgi:transcriptional regulator with XRE-family HTH domain|nr:helix-turn-helix domain-containing protein [Lachnospiraceae bacterium]